MKQSGIYKILNLTNGKFYIGSSINLKRREQEHFRLLRKKEHRNTILQNSFNKYGESNFQFMVLELCTIDKLLEREQFYIDNANPIFNICKLAGHSLGYKHTEQAKLKMSLIHKGKVVSEDTLQKMRERRASDETKLKMSNTRKGRKVSEETKRRMKIAAKKKNIDYLFKGNMKQVIQTSKEGNIIKEWDSIKDAIQNLKLKSGSAISNCLKGISKTAHGYIWSYKL